MQMSAPLSEMGAQGWGQAQSKSEFSLGPAVLRCRQTCMPVDMGFWGLEVGVSVQRCASREAPRAKTQGLPCAPFSSPRRTPSLDPAGQSGWCVGDHRAGRWWHISLCRERPPALTEPCAEWAPTAHPLSCPPQQQCQPVGVYAPPCHVQRPGAERSRGICSCPLAAQQVSGWKVGEWCEVPQDFWGLLPCAGSRV